MFQTIIKDNYDAVSKEAFQVMKAVLDEKEDAVLGLATGSSPLGLYQEMVKDFKETGRSYAKVVTFNLDEYVGLPKDHEQSYYTFMHQNLFDLIDCQEKNIHIPCGDGENPTKDADAFEREIQKYVIDIQVLGIGSDGHIAFNEPGTPFDSLTHVTELAKETIQDNARFFDFDTSKVPTKAVTQGLATIMRAKKILLIATGKNKADAIATMIQGEQTVDCPASVLQNHQDVTVILDPAAAAKL